jgi:hypothetical protein
MVQFFKAVAVAVAVNALVSYSLLKIYHLL